ncbi:MAG: helix-turn-helix transcriptional regulator [Gordonibacter sp.]|uniref:helix-turn-helix transcriptional regulator n=1 Tax=Gordonibacter sp. TaxID=1968902 RepID=UPI002FC8D63C
MTGDLSAETASDDARTPDDLRLTYVLATVGFALLIGWELSATFSPSLALLAFCDIREASALRIVSVSTLATTFALCARRADWVFENRNRLFAIGSLVALPAVANAFVNNAFEGIPFIASLVSWALLGVAQASIMMHWCVFFSLIPTRRTAVCVSLGSIGGTLLFVLANASDTQWLNLFEIALFIVGSVGLAAFLSTRIPPERILSIEKFRRTTVLTVPASLSVACQGAVYGFMTIELCSMGPIVALIGGASGIAGVLVALLWALLGSKVDIDMAIVQRISLPILIAGILLFPFFDGAGKVVCGGMVVAALAHSTIVGWCTTSIDNYEFRLHPIDRFALRQAPSNIGFFVGAIVAFVILFVYPLSGTQLSLLMVVFALVVILMFCVYGGDDAKMRRRLNELLAPPIANNSSGGAGGEQSSQAGFFRKRCDCVSERYGLTPREEEVFFLLAKGRNAEYIAEQLVVSSATAKSHIYHIYRKLDINSQQHLMNIVEECDEA